MSLFQKIRENAKFVDKVLCGIMVPHILLGAISLSPFSNSVITIISAATGSLGYIFLIVGFTDNYDRNMDLALYVVGTNLLVFAIGMGLGNNITLDGMIGAAIFVVPLFLFAAYIGGRIRQIKLMPA